MGQAEYVTAIQNAWDKRMPNTPFNHKLINDIAKAVRVVAGDLQLCSRCETDGGPAGITHGWENDRLCCACFDYVADTLWKETSASAR